MPFAYAIHSIGTRDETGKKVLVPASTKTVPSIFEIDEDRFNALVAAGAVRAPSDEELAAAKVAVDEVSETEVPAPVDPVAPASGAQGDPQGKPKSRKSKAVAEEPVKEEAPATEDDEI